METEIQETVQNKPVFDPDFHTELIIKDEFENLDSGNLDFCKTRDLEKKKFEGKVKEGFVQIQPQR